MKRQLSAFLLILLSVTGAYAQLTSCTQTLRLARSTYEQGRLHGIPDLLDECLRGSGGKSFTLEEKVEAYKLLCLTYIYLEEPQKADEAMLNLLRTNNYFEIKPDTDPAEFVALYRTFRTDPVYRIGVQLGANASIPNVVSYLPSNDLPSEYNYGLAFQGGVVADIPLKFLDKKLTFHPELLFAMKSFKYLNEGTYTDETPDGQPFSREFVTNGTDNYSYISLPLMIQYRIQEKKFRPFAALSISADYLLSARSTFFRTKEDATSLDEQSLDVKGQREKLNISAMASIGVKVKVTGGLAVAELRYSHGLTNINNEESIYANFNRTNPTGGYVDGVFKLNSLSFTLGYVYNRFNPKKLHK